MRIWGQNRIWDTILILCKYVLCPQITVLCPQITDYPDYARLHADYQ